MDFSLEKTYFYDICGVSFRFQGNKNPYKLGNFAVFARLLDFILCEKKKMSMYLAMLVAWLKHEIFV